MRKIFHGMGACTAVLLVGGMPLMAAPANDTCNNRQTIGTGTTEFDTTGATPDLDTATCGYDGEIYPTVDVWYQYTAAATGNIVFTSVNCDSVLSIQFSIYDSCGGAELACNSDLCNEGPLVFSAVQGHTYVIRVATYTSFDLDGPGSFSIAVKPDNETCATAQHITGPGQYDFDTTLATKDGTASCEYSDSIPTDTVDIYYQYTAASTGTAILEYINCGGSGSVSNVGGIAQISVTSSCGASDLDCSPNGCTRSLDIAVVQGQSYLIRVATYVGGIPGHVGSATLKISEIPAVSNDNCSGAQTITEGNVYPWSTYGATTQGLVTCASSIYHTSSHEIWYQFTAPADALYDFTSIAVGSDLSPGLSLHVSCGGAAVGCIFQATFSTTARLSRLMDAGEKIYIRLGVPIYYFSYGDLSGYLTVVNDQPRSYDTCGGALNVQAGSTSFDITSGMAADGAATCGSSNTGPDAYFRFTAGRAGTYLIDTCGSALDTVLSVSTACGSGEIACNGNTGNPSACSTASLGSSALSVNLTAGQIVYIRVASRNLQDRGVGKLNITAPACAADFNHDNVRDVADLFGFINAWLVKTSNADFNGDHIVDVADLFGFINAWLAGC